MTESKTELKIEGRPGGPILTVSYWLTDTATGQWALVDPTYEVLDTWSDRLREAQAPQAIYITHAHFDHTAGAADLLRRFPAAPVWVHPQGKAMLESGAMNGAMMLGFPYTPVAATNFYQEGDTVSLGASRLEIIDAPGHCPGSVLLLSGGWMLAGDVLFAGAVGRWDLLGADYDTLAATIRDKVMTLPDDTVVYPGHGQPTTIGEERRGNTIVQRMLRGEACD